MVHGAIKHTKKSDIYYKRQRLDCIRKHRSSRKGLTKICVGDNKAKVRSGYWRSKHRPGNFANHGPEIIQASRDDIDTVVNSILKTKEMFLRIINCSLERNRIGQNIIMDRYNFECVRGFPYQVAILTGDNDISSEIIAPIEKGNRCFFALHNLFKSELFSTNSNIKNCNTVSYYVRLRN